MAEKVTKKGRYRRVEVRTWGDEKFRRLSRIPPSGKGLWLFLITGPHTSPIPGLFRAGRAGMAEELDWSTEAFDQAFAEVLKEGMAEADWEGRVVWLPNALKHNMPESPNVVLSWGTEWDLIPECDLKAKAWKSMRQLISQGFSEPFLKAFDKALPKPSWKPSGKEIENSEKPSGNQEQEAGSRNSEQEQERSRALLPPSGGSGDLAPGTEGVNGHDLLGDPASRTGKRKRAPPCPYEQIVTLYHEMLCPPLPMIEALSETRRGQIRARWENDLPDMENWKRYFADVATKPFLMGKKPGREGRKPFKASLEWLTNQSNFLKVAEGQYDE